MILFIFTALKKYCLMKKFIIALLIPVIFLSCKSKDNANNGNVVEKWDNGNPKVTKEITDKATDSYTISEFYKDGSLKSKMNYKEGKLDGSVKLFDDEGYLSVEKKYNKGILLSEYNYKYGKLNGSEKIYHPNGQLWTERLLYNGRAWEVVSNFDSTGKPMDPGTLKEGFGTIKLYDSIGNIKEIKKYREGLEVLAKDQANADKK